jgi:hypothetical protein
VLHIAERYRVAMRNFTHEAVEPTIDRDCRIAIPTI